MIRKFDLIGFVVLIILSITAIAWFFYEDHATSSVHQSYLSEESSLNLEQAELDHDIVLAKHLGTNLSQEKTIPKYRGESSIIREFSDTANQTGTQVHSVNFIANSSTSNTSPDRGTKSQGPTGALKNTVNVQVTVSGTTGQLLNFMNLIQSNSRFAVVSDCELSTDSSKTQISVQFEFPYTQG